MLESTMQDFPLTIAMILRHGRTVHGDSEVVTFEGDGSRRASFAEVARRAEQRAAAGADVLRYDEVVAGEDAGFAWPEVEERAAAAMCYTSGTTGNPKGVMYSHRSTVLHSFGINQAGAIGLTQHDRVLPVVPMFH